MLILGKNSDDKGHQLERLTRDLLAAMGYTDIVTNLIGAGGQEIDVRARYIIAGLGGGESVTVFCECKAYREPVALPAWHQFLGKLFHQLTISAEDVRGCFIALSGVNGNVQGNYEALKQAGGRVKLVTGSDLFHLTSQHFASADLDVVVSKIQRMTDRHYREAELAYYDDRTYWIVLFEDDSYTVLAGGGDTADSKRLPALREMIEEQTAATKYVDLQQEAEASRRRVRVEKEVVGQFFLHGGRVSRAAGLAASDDVTSEEITAAVLRLQERGWIAQEPAGDLQLVLARTTGAEFSPAVHLLTFLLHEYVLTAPLGCAFYDSLVDERLVAEILHLQADIPLSDADVGQATLLLRWSPSALAWALQPDPMIVTHRVNQPFVVNQETNQFARNYFFGRLCRALAEDFGRSELNGYFFNVRGLRELETMQQLVVKDSAGVLHRAEIHERNGKAPAQGGGIASVLLLDSAPQPWEVPGWKGDNAPAASSQSSGPESEGPDRDTRT